jgi:magnesium-transporting ATPase (P-type)
MSSASRRATAFRRTANSFEAQGVSIDESILTGESVPVDKGDTGEIFSGTLLVRGKSYALVTRTGEKSAMGKLAVMIGGIEAGKTPLERRLDVFGRQIAYAIFGSGGFSRRRRALHRRHRAHRTRFAVRRRARRGGCAGRFAGGSDA